MAFYARSEEARQSHSVHKLALVSSYFVAMMCLLLTAGSLNIAFSPYAFSLSSGIILVSLQGTLALEEALSSGSPIRTEVDCLRKSLEGIDKDSLLELALSSLPEDVLEYGSDTPMELKQKVNSCVMYCCLISTFLV
jgi:mitofilin